jgi:hypothetical protein
LPNSRARLEELKARCQAHHEHLVSLASYAEALVEACREEANLEARTIVMNARERSDALLSESRERADELLIAARHEADGMRAEAKRLSAAISTAAREQADVTLAEAKSEAERLITDARARADSILAAAAPLVTAFPSLAAAEPQPPAVLPPLPDAVASASSAPEFVREEEPPPVPETITFLPDMGYERTLEVSESDEARGPFAPMSLLEQRQSVATRLDDEVANPPQRRSTGGLLIAVGTAVLLVGGAAAFYVSWPTRRTAVSDVRSANDAAAPIAPSTATAAPPSSTDPASGPSDTAPAATASPTSAPAGSALSVTVSARRRAWVRLGTDGKPGTSGFLQPGDKRVLNATRDVDIHSGDAGALLVSVNGGPAAPFGKDGAVLTRRLSASSDGTSSAAAAPVATAGAAVPAASSEANASDRNRTKTPAPVNGLPAAPPVVTASKAPNASVPPPAAPSAAAPLRLADASNAPDAAQPVRTPTPARDSSASAPAATTGRTDPGATDASTARLTRADLLQAEHAWFDARYRGDHLAMSRVAAREFDLKDDRTVRPTPGVANIERIVRNLAVDIWGGGAVVTGQMTERPKGGTGADAVESSFVETWIQRDGRWQMLGLRLLPPKPAPR